MHASIAPPAQGVTHPGLIRDVGPMFQHPDGAWNHGEGFRPGSLPDADSGGWHGLDAGAGVEIGDVHSYHLQNPSYPQGYWTPYTFSAEVHPLAQVRSGVTQRRFVGYLRPAGLALGIQHPRYPGNTKPWVDNGAFELIAPSVQSAWPTNPASPQKIVLVLCIYPTQDFPPAMVTPPGGGAPTLQSVDWRNTYLGYFSPDGLIRKEAGTTAAAFEANIGVDAIRSSIQFAPVWEALGGNSGQYGAFYPICGYAVSTVKQRQTELVHQRVMQLVKAMKLILMDAQMTPLSRALTATEVADRVVVVFTGGSNGGLQSSLAGMLHPDIVHGAFGTTINPSLQRLLGEQDMGWAVAAASGFADAGSDYDPIDGRNWAHFPWIRGLELHDLSLPRRYHRGEIWRPFCHYMGGEDITASGTDVVTLLSGGGYLPSGITPQIHLPGLAHAEVAWMVADKRCHATGEVLNPYTMQPTFHEQDVALDLIARAVQNRASELASQTSVPTSPIQHLPRGPGESLRGVDDPQEWAHGRLGQPVPPANVPSAPLVRDDWFFNQLQPGAVGTWPAMHGSAIIQDQRLFVGDASGVVSRLKIDWNHPRQPLVVEQKSHPLGQQAWALAVWPSGGGSWQLIVGTRRHLHKLDPVTMLPSLSVELPWERGMPYHLRVMDILPGNPGNEIVYASMHGGLCIHGGNLNFLQELAEPGIKDFAPAGNGLGADAVALLSERGVLARVAIDNAGAPKLLASSVLQNGAPLGMTRANVLLPGLGSTDVLVSLYSGDEQGLSLRVFLPGDLTHATTIANAQTLKPPAIPLGEFGLGQRSQVITARHVDSQGDEGDHIILLDNDELVLLNQGGAVVGRKRLYREGPPNGPTTLYTPGLYVGALAVGDLGGSVSSNYPDQIVLCGLAGQLAWLHVADLAAAGDDLPAVYTMVTGAGSANQPRASQSMSATWAMARKPGDNLLHVLDQSGNYWQVDYFGSRTLVRREFGVATGSKRGWDYVGPVTGVAPTLPPAEVMVQHLPPGQTAGVVTTSPWTPIKPLAVVFEQQPGQHRVPFNWQKTQPQNKPFLEGFLVHHGGGSVRPLASGGYEVYSWSGISADWANFVEGVRLQSGVVTGIWASNGQPTQVDGQGHGDLVPFHDFRNEIIDVPYMNTQSMRTVQVSGQTYVVLGCPGGRVRILQPGSMRTDNQTSHGLGPIPIPAANVSDDFGHGTCGLAVRENGSNLDVFVGTMYGHPSPGAYPNGPLANGEVLSGMVRHLQWSPGSGFSTVRTIDLHPTAADARGGFGVVGLLVGDLLVGNAGDELVVTTIEGDLFVYAVNGGNLLYRTWVPGAVGCFNAIVAADLNGNGRKELYLAGAYGIYRFVAHDEPPAEAP